MEVFFLFFLFQKAALGADNGLVNVEDLFMAMDLDVRVLLVAKYPAITLVCDLTWGIQNVRLETCSFPRHDGGFTPALTALQI